MTSPSTPNTISGRNAFVELLQSEGVTHLFGNPGTTELPIMHALADYPDMRYVLGLQEAIVVAMADGYARASGKLVSCNVHVAPGLGNAIGSIYTSFMSGTPMIVTAGQQEQGHGLTEPLLYAPLVPIATPVVKWATEVNRIEDLPRILRRAAKVATTAPTGPVFISLPGDILNNAAALDLGPLPASPRVASIAALDAWRALAVADLRGAVLTLDAGSSWRPVPLPIEPLRVAPLDEAFSVAGFDHARALQWWSVLPDGQASWFASSPSPAQTARRGVHPDAGAPLGAVHN